MAGRETSRVNVVDAVGVAHVAIEFATVALESTREGIRLRQAATSTFYELDDGTPLIAFPGGGFIIRATGAILRRR